MTDDISQHLTITLREDGFFIEFSEQATKFSPKEIVIYLESLNIPMVELGAVKEAFESGSSEGPQLFAPPLRKGGAAAPQPRKRKRAVKWIRPVFPPGTKYTPLKNILVVGATDVMVNFFKKTFMNAKFSISLANNFQLFSKAISSKPQPELIMLAAKLGNSDMGPIAEKIRLGQSTRKIPVIMYSAPRNRQEIMAGFDSGITEYFVMPMPESSFQAKVKGVLHQIKKNIDINGSTKKATEEKSVESEEVEVKKEYSVSLLTLSKKVEKVLASPLVLDRVMKISDDSVSGANDLAKAVETDMGTTAMVLKKSNSAFYGRRDPITKVQEAIVRVGFKEVKTLVLAMSVIKQFSTEQKSNGFDRLEYWKHCLATGMLAKLFAKQVKYPDPEKAFLGGLLHDLGKIVFDEHANPPYDDIVMDAMKKRIPLVVAEKEALGFTHANLGKLVLDNWNFPEEYSILVKRHHNVETRSQEQVKPQDLLLTRLVYMGNVLAKALNVGSAGDLSIFELPMSEWVKNMPRLNFNEDTKAEFYKELTETGEFLGLSGGIIEPTTEVDPSLPTVFIIDPFVEVRPINIVKVHLESAGYNLESHEKVDNIPKDLGGKKGSVCLILDREDKLNEFMAKIKKHFLPLLVPITIILPEPQNPAEKETPEKVVLQSIGHKLLHEPFDVEELQRCLENNE